MTLSQETNKSYLLLLLVLTLVANSNCYNRCNIDRAYRYRICNTIQDYLNRRSSCDPEEILMLQTRIISLRRTLRDLQAQEQRLRESVIETSRACDGEVFGGKCYFLLDETGLPDMKTYSQAESACRSQQADLVSIRNREIYNFVYEFILTQAKDFTHRARNLVVVWTGSSYTNGQIYLTDNTTPAFAKWSPHHPTNRTGQIRVGIAVATNPQSRGMFDTMPTSRLYPMCEKTI